jgi:hypothetical protein
MHHNPELTHAIEMYQGENRNPSEFNVSLDAIIPSKENVSLTKIKPV